MDELIEHHTLTKEKVLNEFSNRHGIKVAEHEQLSLMKLDNEIEEQYFTFEDRAYVSIFFTDANMHSNHILTK